MCICVLYITVYIRMYSLYSIYMCIQLYSAKRINDVALQKINFGLNLDVFDWGLTMDIHVILCKRIYQN